MIQMWSGVVDSLLLLVFYLHLSRHGFSKKMEGFIVILAYIPLRFLYVLISLLALLVSLLARGVPKVIIVFLMGFILVVMYALSWPVPYIGRLTVLAESVLRDHLSLKELANRATRFRNLLIETTVKNDPREPEFETVDEFRDGLERIKKSGKKRLERGETTLSLVLGISLLGGQITGVDVLQASVFSVGVLLIVEVWLLVIAGSAIYRTAVIEMLSYERDVDFESIDRFDAALSYQRAVTQFNVVQILMLLVAVVQIVGDYRKDLIEIGVEKSSEGMSLPDVLSLLWNKMRNQDS